MATVAKANNSNFRFDGRQIGKKAESKNAEYRYKFSERERESERARDQKKTHQIHFAVNRPKREREQERE